jgi:hypothetical protein
MRWRTLARGAAGPADGLELLARVEPVRPGAGSDVNDANGY